MGRLWPALLLALVIAGCGDDSSSKAQADDEADQAPDTPAPLSDTQDPADVAEPDAGPDVATEPGATEEPDTTAQPDVAEPEPLPETGVAVLPEELAGLFVYGISADPASLIAQLGFAVGGIRSVRAVIELGEGGLAVIRVVDQDTGEPVSGPDGVIESFRWNLLDDGRVWLDLSQPVDVVRVQMAPGCLYSVVGTALVSAPTMADGLLTWPVLETFTSSGCGGGGLPGTFGLDIHYLRRADAGADFSPRPVDPDAPFGFFQVEGEARELRLARLPVADGVRNGSIRYHVSDSFPAELRPAITAVFESWNDVFEDALGVRPLATVDGDPGLVPWDPRYRVINWDSAHTDGAIAPFLEDPTTGEMFDTDVVMWLGDLEAVVAKFQKFLDKNPDAVFSPLGGSDTAMALPLGDPAAAPGPAGALRWRQYHRRDMPWADMAALHRASQGAIAPRDLATYVVGDFLAHELGHNLGLRHNFKASIDRDHHGPDVPATSVMDYVFGMAMPGTYDRDAVRYAYGAGAAETGYFYCTDEHVDLDPGCARWDYGHPVLHFLSVLDSMAEQYPPGTSVGELNDLAQEQDWGKVFLRVRQFVNTEYEGWEPEEPVDTFHALLDRVTCTPECEIHNWFRSDWALQLLYTKHAVGGGGWGQTEWKTLPPLDEVQSAELMGAYFALIIDPAQPLSVKKVIIDKLPTANVQGAGELLDTLQTYFEGLEEPTTADNELLALVKKAQQ